jgi:hypothetical protein
MLSFGLFSEHVHLMIVFFSFRLHIFNPAHAGRALILRSMLQGG